MSKMILIFKILYHKYFYLKETLDIDNIGYSLKFIRGYTKVFVWNITFLIDNNLRVCLCAFFGVILLQI